VRDGQVSRLPRRDTTFVVDRVLPGVKRGGNCVVAPRGKTSREPCLRLVVLRGSFTHQDVAGANSVRFTGWLAAHNLVPGRCRLVATPAIGGVMGAAVSAGFMILG
jgi:hypothetical protein